MIAAPTRREVPANDCARAPWPGRTAERRVFVSRPFGHRDADQLCDGNARAREHAAGELQVGLAQNRVGREVVAEARPHPARDQATVAERPRAAHHRRPVIATLCAVEAELEFVMPGEARHRMRGQRGVGLAVLDHPHATRRRLQPPSLTDGPAQLARRRVHVFAHAPGAGKLLAHAAGSKRNTPCCTPTRTPPR